MDATPPSSARAALRAATRDVHEALHTHPMLGPLTSTALTRDQYRRTLEAFYGFHAPLEPALVAAAAALGRPAAYPAAVRTGWLEADLRALGHADTTLAQIPRARLPTPRTLPELAGCLYVVEGSALGGAVIARRVARHVGVEWGSATFFRGHGEATGRRWTATCDLLEAVCATPDDRAVGVRSARDCFAALGAWMTAAHPCGTRTTAGSKSCSSVG